MPSGSIGMMEASRPSTPLPSAGKRFPSMAKLLNLPYESLTFSQQYMVDSVPLLHFAIDTFFSYGDPADYEEAVKNPKIAKALLCLVDFTVLNGTFRDCMRNYLPQKDANKLLKHVTTVVENIVNRKFDQEFIENTENAKIKVLEWLAATLILEVRLSGSMTDKPERFQRNTTMLANGYTKWIDKKYSTPSFFKLCDAILKEIDPKTGITTAGIYYGIQEQLCILKSAICVDFLALITVRELAETLDGHIQEAIDACLQAPSPAFKLVRNLFEYDTQLKLLLRACLRAPDFEPLLKETDEMYAPWWSVSKKYKKILKLALKQVKEETIPDPYSVVLINRLLITSMACGMFQTVSAKEVEAACAEMKSALAAVAPWAPAYFRMEVDNDLKIILEGLLPLLRQHDRGAGVSPLTTPGFLDVYTPEKVHDRLYRDENMMKCAACGEHSIDLYACSRVSCCLVYFFKKRRPPFFIFFLTYSILFFISQCKQAWYCDSVCQKNHFPAHKKACKEAQAKKEAASSSTAEQSPTAKIISFPTELLKLRDIPPQQRLPSQTIMVSSMEKLEFAVTTIREQGKHDALDFKLPQVTKAMLALVEVVVSNGTVASFGYYLPPHIVNELEYPLQSTFASIYNYNFKEEDGGNPPPQVLVSAFFGLFLATAYQIASNFESGNNEEEAAMRNSVCYLKFKPLLVYNTPENISKCNEYLQKLGSDLTAELLINGLINNKLSLELFTCFYTSFYERDSTPVDLANQLRENLLRALEMGVGDPFYKKTASLFALDVQFKAMTKGMARHNVQITDKWWHITSAYIELLKKAVFEAKAAVPADAYSAAVAARALLHALVCGVLQRVTYQQVEEACEELKKNAAACAEWSPPQWQRLVKADIEIVEEDVLPFLEAHDGVAGIFTSGLNELYTPAAVSSRLSKGLEGTEMCACCGKRGTDLVKCFGCECVWYCMNKEKPGKPSKCQVQHQEIHTKDVCQQMKTRRFASRMVTEGFQVQIIPEEGGGFGLGFKVAEKDDD
jgi:hypothetical protein